MNPSLVHPTSESALKRLEQTRTTQLIEADAWRDNPTSSPGQYTVSRAGDRVLGLRFIVDKPVHNRMSPLIDFEFRRGGCVCGRWNPGMGYNLTQGENGTLIVEPRHDFFADGIPLIAFQFEQLHVVVCQPIRRLVAVYAMDAPSVRRAIATTPVPPMYDHEAPTKH